MRSGLDRRCNRFWLRGGRALFRVRRRRMSRERKQCDHGERRGGQRDRPQRRRSFRCRWPLRLLGGRNWSDRFGLNRCRRSDRFRANLRSRGNRLVRRRRRAGSRRFRRRRFQRFVVRGRHGSSRPFQNEWRPRVLCRLGRRQRFATRSCRARLFRGRCRAAALLRRLPRPAGLGADVRRHLERQMDTAPGPDGGDLDHTFRHNERSRQFVCREFFLRECEEAASALTGRSVDFQLYASTDVPGPGSRSSSNAAAASPRSTFSSRRPSNDRQVS